MKQTTTTSTLPFAPSIPIGIAVLAAAVLVPFLVHLIPYHGGAALGAIWIPLFYVPLIAVLIWRFQVAFVAGVLAPFVNFFIMGMPEISIVLLLAGEVALFLVFVSLMLKHRVLKWLAAPLAFGLAKMVSAQFAPLLPFEMSPWEFLTNALTNAWPGLVVLLLIQIVVLKLWKNRS